MAHPCHMDRVDRLLSGKYNHGKKGQTFYMRFRKVEKSETGPFPGYSYFMIFLLFCQQVDKGERVEQWKKLVQDVVLYTYIYDAV